MIVKSKKLVVVLLVVRGILFECGEDEEDEPEKTVELSHHP